MFIRGVSVSWLTPHSTSGSDDADFHMTGNITPNILSKNPHRGGREVQSGVGRGREAQASLTLNIFLSLVHYLL